MGRRPKRHAAQRSVEAKRPLAELLREIRRDAGVSIKQAGRELGVSYTYLSKLENGVTSPSTELLGRLVDYFGHTSGTLYAAAGKLPPDVAEILADRGDEAFALLRRRFGRGR